MVDGITTTCLECKSLLQSCIHPHPPPPPPLVWTLDLILGSWGCGDSLLMTICLSILIDSVNLSSLRLPCTGLKFKLPTRPMFYYQRLVGSLYFETGWGNFDHGQVGSINFQPVWGFIFQNIPDRSEIYTSNLSKVLFSKYHRQSEVHFSTQSEVINYHRMVGSVYFLPVWDNFEIKPWTGWKFKLWRIKHWPVRKDLLELYLP